MQKSCSSTLQKKKRTADEVVKLKTMYFEATDIVPSFFLTLALCILCLEDKQMLACIDWKIDLIMSLLLQLFTLVYITTDTTILSLVLQVEV